MTDEPIYGLKVEGSRGELLCHCTGTRETLIEIAMRVVLDAAPRWDTPQWARPTFRVDIWKTTRD